ncbi:DUF2797 domain-containing protein [Candidatus Thorarchaeota archaeon]|nr:MAG: DUF2797 domain-containing protein [Candidatus Thorarchaeota archaeon]
MPVGNLSYEGKSMHVLGVKWFVDDDESYKHGLQYWTGEEHVPAIEILSRGKEITWTLVGPRRCIGYRDESGNLHRCPEYSIVKGNQKRCGPCAAMDFYDECVFCDGSSCRASPARRERCRNAHYVVYLTAFGDGTLKVGVSVRSRLMTRWLEQGADYGAVLVEVQDGKKARRIESHLSHEESITSSVRFGRKVDALTSDLSVPDVEGMIDYLYSSNALAEIVREFNLQLKPPGVQSLATHYGFPVVDMTPAVWPKRRRGLHGQQVLGEILGMKGPLLLLETGKTKTAINLRRLIGYTIDPESEVTYVSQSSLLEHL